MNDAAATILFVDDEERILRSLQVLFRPHYRVLVTTDPQQALAWVAAGDVDVVVSDQRMPQMQGAELLARIRASAPATVRILLTGYSDTDAALAALNDGEIWRYLAKPWSIDGIRRTVADAVVAARALRSVNPAGAPATAAAAGEVLVIDEDVETLVTLQRLVGARTAVHHAASLSAAVQVIGTRPVGLVVTDVVVAGDDMTHLLRTLKTEHPEILSIVVTAMRDTTRLIRLINQAQVFRYLPKPLRAGILAKGVEAALGRERDSRRAPAVPAAIRVEDADSDVARNFSTRIASYLTRLRSRSALPTA